MTNFKFLTLLWRILNYELFQAFQIDKRKSISFKFDF